MFSGRFCSKSQLQAIVWADLRLESWANWLHSRVYIIHQSSAADARYCCGAGVNGKLDRFNSADYCIKAY